MYSIKAFLAIYKSLSLGRLYNLWKCYVSFYTSRYVQNPILSHRPFTMSFEPTTQCNLGCPECPSGLKSFTRNTGHAELSLLEKLLEESKDSLIFLYLYFQGEPLIHKGFSDMVRLAKRYRIYTITSTNGHYLTPSKSEEIVQSGLDRILISIDGATQEVYESYRREGSLEKVIEGTRNLIQARKKLRVSHPEIIFQMLVVRPNEHQIEDVKRLGKELGVDKVVLKTAQVYDFENGNPLIPSDKYARYRRMSDGKWKIKNELKNQCWKMWHSAVSTWDGKVLPCCFDKDAQYEMGNLQTQTMETIWNSPPYIQFRQSLLHARKQIDICQNCSEGTKVWETI